MHVAPHRADAGPAQLFAAAAGHQGLQLCQRRLHAPGGHQHLRHEHTAGGEILAQLIHAPHQSAGQDLLGRQPLRQRLLTKRQHLFPLSPLQGGGQLGQHVVPGVRRSFRRRAGHRTLQHPPGHRRHIEPRQVQPGVVGVDGLVDIGVHMGIHRPRQTVGDGGDEVSQRAALLQHAVRVGPYLLR